MKKAINWIRKNRKKLLLTDALLILSACLLVLSMAPPAKVEGLQVVDSTYSTAHIAWDKSDHATSYKVYRSDNGTDYEYLDTTKDTAYTDKKLKTGKTYYYTVTARRGIKSTAMDAAAAASVMPSLDKPELEVDTSQGEMKLKFSAVDGALGYEVVRDGEVIGQTDKNEFVDEQAELQGGEFNYEVRAFRYEKNPVYGMASNLVSAELHALSNFTVEPSENDLLLKWTDSDHYSSYKIFNGSQELGETTENMYRIPDVKLDTVYDLLLVGYTDDESEKSPEEERRIMVVEEEMTNEEAIEAAVQWGIDIAADDSFTYGAGQRAHRYGCYFCQTNVGPRKNLKGKGKVNGHSYEKTYCCNPFVHACYAHGAGDPRMLEACRDGHGIAMTVKSFTRYGHWKSCGKVSKKNLRRGDVLVRSNHVMMYIGNGQIVQASGGGWDAGSIQVTNLGGRKYSFVMRYTGNGNGVKRVVKDVEGHGNVTEETTDEAAADGATEATEEVTEEASEEA